MAEIWSELFSQPLPAPVPSSDRHRTNLFASWDYILYVYDPASSELRIVDVKNPTKFASIELGGVLDVQALSVSPNNKYVALIAKHDVVIINVPAYRSLRAERFQFHVGEFYNKEEIYQASFHPLSDEHFVILNADSKLRIYHMKTQERSPVLELEVSTGAKYSADQIAERYPVAFAFGKDFAWEALSIYVLLGSGDVLLFCPVLPPGLDLPAHVREQCDALSPEVDSSLLRPAPLEAGVIVSCRAAAQGPFRLWPTDPEAHPPSGASLLVLEHSPTVLVVGSSDGACFVGMVLQVALPQLKPEFVEAEKKTRENKKDKSKKKATEGEKEKGASPLRIFMTERIAVAPGPLGLVADPFVTERFFVSCAEGVWSITLDWLRAFRSVLFEPNGHLPPVDSFKATALQLHCAHALGTPAGTASPAGLAVVFPGHTVDLLVASADLSSIVTVPAPPLLPQPRLQEVEDFEPKYQSDDVKILFERTQEQWEEQQRQKLAQMRTIPHLTGLPPGEDPDINVLYKRVQQLMAELQSQRAVLENVSSCVAERHREQQDILQAQHERLQMLEENAAAACTETKSTAESFRSVCDEFKSLIEQLENAAFMLSALYPPSVSEQRFFRRVEDLQTDRLRLAQRVQSLGKRVAMAQQRGLPGSPAARVPSAAAVEPARRELETLRAKIARAQGTVKAIQEQGQRDATFE